MWMQSGASYLVPDPELIWYFVQKCQAEKKEAECIINEIKPGDETRQEQNVQVQKIIFQSITTNGNRSNEDDDVAITKNCNMIDHRTNQPTNKPTEWNWE